MNSFNVSTPDEWKKNLYSKTENKQVNVIKPTVILAATFATILCMSASVFAVKISKAPQYFGSIFLGDSPVADDVYSEKNYYFDSTKDDLSLECKGIAGDNYSVFILFELKSTGNILFDKNMSYHFENHTQDIPFMWEFSKGMSCKVIDEHTMEISVSLSDVYGGNIAGKTVGMHFENIEVYDINSMKKTDVIECSFSGNITIDYLNTVDKLNATQNTVTIKEIEFKPIKGNISNFHFDYTLEVIDGKELFSDMDEYKMVSGTLTLNYTDGTRDDFRIKMPPENSDDAFGVKIGKTNKKLHVQLKIPKPICADNVTSVEINGCEILIK